jgi:hypothetical protein
MTRAEVRRRLELEWWRQLAITVLPLLVLSLSFGGREPIIPVLEMPLFVAAVASMFVSLPLFSAYKRALATTGKALDSAEEPAAWIELARRRRIAFLGAGLPAWIAILALFTGLNAAILTLLAVASVMLLCLYRIPSQLG